MRNPKRSAHTDELALGEDPEHPEHVFGTAFDKDSSGDEDTDLLSDSD